MIVVPILNFFPGFTTETCHLENEIKTASTSWNDLIIKYFTYIDVIRNIFIRYT